MNILWQNLRYAFRTLSKSPGFAAIAIGTLSLGIGANTAIFSVVRAVLLRPLAFREPERLVTIQERDKDGNPDNTGYLTYLDWRSRNRSFEDMAVMSSWTPKLVGEGAERLEGLRVTDGFFRMLGVQPALGRDFLSSEHVRSNRFVVLLSDGLWKQRFGGDPSLPGKMIRLGDTPYLVAGILPAGFESVFSPDPSRPAEIWAPLGYDASVSFACRDCRHLRAFGRLKSGMTLSRAREDMNAISAALAHEFPAEYSAPGVLLTPLPTALTGPARPALLTLLAAVGFVLLIGCANVASLLVSRSARRRKEIAVRIALGASRSRIVGLFLTEAVLLSLAGGALGLLAASATLGVLVGAAPGTLPRVGAADLDGGVLLFTLGASLVTGLAFGILPAWRASRLDPEATLRGASGASRGRESRRLGGILVVFDVALALVLLSGALLMAKSLKRVVDVDPGFHADGLLTMEIDVSGARYEDETALRHFYDQVLERVAALPGVTGAGVVSQLPLGGNMDRYGVHSESNPSANPEQDPYADRYAVSPGFLGVMQIPLRRGRALEEFDRADTSPVVLINETLARIAFRGANPVGQRVKVGALDGPWRTVVGVVGDVRHTALEAPAGPQIYLPRAQWVDGDMALVVRAADPAALAGPVRAAIASIDPDQPVLRVATMPRVIAASTAGRRFLAGLLAGFAALATLLASVGIFGVISGFVGERTREIGIRLALGSERGAIARLVSGETLRLSLAGVAVGLAGTLALGRLLRSQLFGVGPHDPLVLALSSATIVGVAMAATLAPARRAMAVDPMAALRTD